MATSNYSGINIRALPAPAPVFNFFARITAMIEQRSERARIRHELNTMSDRELADLGLSASDIADVAAGTYRRD